MVMNSRKRKFFIPLIDFNAPLCFEDSSKPSTVYMLGNKHSRLSLSHIMPLSCKRSKLKISNTLKEHEIQ